MDFNHYIELFVEPCYDDSLQAEMTDYDYELLEQELDPIVPFEDSDDKWIHEKIREHELEESV